ncbi:MAG: alpha/beta hydrolase, partial [Lachnospiraceae bacterium]|nr:alpha/beta hydrolase [Lachnospiraceae bacterium]
DGARKGELLGTTFDPENIPEKLVSWDGLALDGNYIRVAQTIDVNAAIDKYKKPVLIVHGAKDDTVPLECSKEYAKRYNNCKLVITPEDGHCFEHNIDMVTEAISEFLSEL